MARRLSLVIGILSCGLIGSAQQPDPSFATLSNLVVVPTLVLDKRGELLRGLTIDDFEVLEDGKPMPIEAFVAPGDGNAAAEGRLVVLVLDNLVSPPELAPQVRRIATSFVKRMSAADTISVITVSGGRSVTSDRQAELKAAIDRFRPFVGETTRTPGELAASGLEAIIRLSDQLGKVPHRRKVMVFIGAASVFSPQEPSAFEDRGPSLSERWFDAIRVTARENVSVYAVDPLGFTRSTIIGCTRSRSGCANPTSASGAGRGAADTASCWPCSSPADWPRI